MSRPWLHPGRGTRLNGNEKAYVMDCLDSTWISSRGKYVDRFESEFAEFCGTSTPSPAPTARRHCTWRCCAGSRAGRRSDRSDPDLRGNRERRGLLRGPPGVRRRRSRRPGTIDPRLIEAKITPRTKGIIAVHLFGHPADMDAIGAIARRHGLFVLEDAAQAHGAEYRGRRVGSLGDVATFSFFGNKIITTGEGGMVTTNDDELAKHCGCCGAWHGPDRVTGSR